MSKKAARIMLVEDNPGDVYLLEEALHSKNIEYELTRYEDGEQAMRAIAVEGVPAPDVILVDLNLPRRDGFDVLRAVRSIPRLMNVPVGVLTSSSVGKDRHRTALIGITRYILKPTTLEEFVDQVGRAVTELLALRPPDVL